MKKFLISAWLIGLAIQFILLWINLVQGVYEPETEYQGWMLLILITGSACFVGGIMQIIMWGQERRKR